MTSVNPVEKENILARLKRETAHQHEQTENQMPFNDANFSLADYKHLLVNFYNFYKVLEPRIEQSLQENSIDFDYGERLKTPKVLADVQNLDVKVEPNSEISADDLPTLDSAEKVFGALYVVEGSTLGGQVISRLLKKKFDLDESNGAAFFSGYGTRTGERWNAFRAAITGFAENSDGHDEIIGAAIETFEKFGRAVGK